MYHLNNDYSETAHPAVLAAIGATAGAAPGANAGDLATPQYTGYSLRDPHCRRAAQLIREHIGKSEEEVDVHFFVGGTQTNTVAITAALRPWEAAIAVPTGHIAVHETGAIEACGHKVITTAATPDGKMTPALVEDVLKAHSSEHMVAPRMVYISNTTEIGTLYTRAELEALSILCKARNLIFFLDGARLGSALTSAANDVTMKDIADLTDAFYIGGTKNGSMFGEALVVSAPALKPNLRHLIKQHGCLLAKGWLLGVQFEALFTDKLFYRCGQHANDMALILRNGVKECGYEFLADSFTNQQFVKFPASVVAQLDREFVVSHEGDLGNGMLLIRLCTSWATSEDQCHRFVKLLKSITAAAN